MNYQQLREQAGLTLEKAAKASGYGIATINGLEKHGEGSGRLKAKLLEIYGIQKPAVISSPGILLDVPRKKDIARLTKIADALAEQLGELRQAINDLQK
jgi:transcriptional regulator with XRE-family HTH domain